MQCFEHGKDYMGACNWCGKQLCSLCIGKQKGKKIYCQACSQKLSEFDIDKPEFPEQKQARSMSSEIDAELGTGPVKKDSKPGFRFPFRK